MKRILMILSALCLPSLCVSGMDRLDALSQIESRNNDYAIGRQHEVSRYQILPAFWARARELNKLDASTPTDSAAAREVVLWIMDARCKAFEARYHRAPNDFEYYILWHRPACFVGRPVPRPMTAAEKDRGRRFAHLCESSRG